jgi:lipopolysaccharide export LptBFGC system permease protein LptF
LSTRFDIEEIQANKTEKFLAVVLAVFCLIGGVWTYQKIDDKVAERVNVDAPVSAADEAAISRRDAAQGRLFQARDRADAARRNLVFRREEYRTALDAGRNAPRLEQLYRQSQARLAAAELEARTAEREVERASPAAAAAEKRRAAEFERRQDRRELYTFLLRLGFVLALLAAAFPLVLVLHRRRSRYVPLALGFAGFVTALSFVLAGDYLTDYIDPLDLGILALSLFGVAMTVLAFALLQRYLDRRLPARRVRKGQCPFCGYPVRGNDSCEGCGRDVVAPCARCEQPRRVGTMHCGACGAA